MERKSLKRIITEAVYEKLPAGHPWSHIPMDDLVFSWWMTGRSGGLRLTDIGDDALQLAEIEFFISEMPEKIAPNEWYCFLIDLSKKMKCPYFLGVKNKIPYIRIYDSKIAVLIALYGTIREYLKSIQIR